MTFEEFNRILVKEFPDVTESQIAKFRLLEGLYREWNARINVISRKDMDELYSHHVLHSLAIARFCPELSGEVLDLGTGGGFPGIPLAIMFPEVRFTLCDSIGKKIKVADAVAGAVGLDNVETVNARAESLGKKFDYIVSRAVTSLDNFLPWVDGQYSKGILYLKGGDINEEIAQAGRKCHLKPSSVHTWPISTWLKDNYFDSKYVIFIEKFCR